MTLAFGTKDPEFETPKTPSGIGMPLFVIAVFALLIGIGSIGTHLARTQFETERKTHDDIVASTQAVTANLRIRQDAVRSDDGTCSVVVREYRRLNEDRLFRENAETYVHAC